MNVSRGRPRDTRKDEEVRSAARRVLAERGYQAATIPAVARRAGVGAPTVYRRWATRSELVAAALDTPPALVAGSFVDAVRVLVRDVARWFADPATRAAVPGLLVEHQREPERYAALVAGAEDPLRDAFRAHHEAAVARGEVAGHPSADTLFDVVVGTAMYHGVVRNTVDDAGIDALVGVVLAAAGLHTGPRASARG